VAMVAEADRPVKLVSASEGYRTLQYTGAALTDFMDPFKALH
jgi:hypothetical protein